MTEGEIWFNYQRAMAQADALDRIAGQVKNTASGPLEQGLHETSVYWRGENAKRYQAKGRRLQERMNRSARSLETAAGEVRAAARRAREIELANLAVIQNQST